MTEETTEKVYLPVSGTPISTDTGGAWSEGVDHVLMDKIDRRVQEDRREEALRRLRECREDQKLFKQIHEELKNKAIINGEYAPIGNK